MDTKQEPTFDQDLSTIVSQLPPPVRAFFVSGKVDTVVKNLMQKYQLHIDQGAVVEREIVLLLLGLKDSIEFTQSLAEDAKLDKKIVGSIMQYINTEIFTPLKEAMRSGLGKTDQPAKLMMPPTQNAALRPVPANARESSHVPPLQSPISRSIPIAPPAAGIPQRNFTPPVQPVHPPVSNIPPTRPVVVSSLKPTDSARMLEDHEEPHIEFNKPLAPVRPSAAEFQKVSPILARTAPPAAGLPKGSMPPNLPGVIPSGGRPNFTIVPTIPKVQIPAPPTANVLSRPPAQAAPLPASTDSLRGVPLPPVPEPVKPYSSDPYREPIDEK